MADVILEVVIPEAKIADLQSACDIGNTNFSVRIMPCSEFEGTKAEYAAYILKQALRAWYIDSLDKQDKDTFRNSVKTNSYKDLG